ncbi:uncharacterized protein IUM83_19801 [Phytophthora cinnamomi]|uniref:uncharacterized protein n=1 Tax=Phytophthora cinnamomi TaxID=4785 RepID=UPI00355A2F06|nr:hypothetical protein IUM83_19801 [Phytophthora cinnamomi]
MNLKAVVVALCEEMRRFAAGTDRRSTSEDPDMTNAVAHLEVLHKRVEATAMQRDKTAEGLKPEQMTAEHVDACLNLIENLQKMVAAGQYKQRAEEALAQYIGVLTRALRASFLASFLQQTQDLKELDDTNEELDSKCYRDSVFRRCGPSGSFGTLSLLTPEARVLLEDCYRDILDMLMKKGDDHPEWVEIHKLFEEVVFQKGSDDTDEEPIV